MSTLHRLTPTPPLGWNSFECFGGSINAGRLLENLAVFRERLLPAGYKYLVIDVGWYRQYDLGEREFPRRGDSFRYCHDGWGRPVPAPCFFPDGLVPMADACHAAGVKFGVHMMRGISRAAVAANTPIKGTRLRARDIANTADTCSWCPDMYGVDMDREGAQAWYDSLIELLASWGIDFIKYDDIVPAPREVDAVVNAIERCERDIVLSLSPGNGHEADGWDAYYRSNMLRISGDIWDSREDFRWVFERWERFMERYDDQPPGFWFDQDMVPFGELQVSRPRPEDADESEQLLSGKGRHRMSGLNDAQKRTFITMRAVGASPIFMGGHLPGTDAYAFDLLTDTDMLACNQNGVTGKLVSYTDWTSSWLARHRERAGHGWFAIFNRDGAGSRSICVNAESLGIPAASRVYDCWRRRPLGDLRQELRMDVPADDVLFARYEPIT